MLPAKLAGISFSTDVQTKFEFHVLTHYLHFFCICFLKLYYIKRIELLTVAVTPTSSSPLASFKRTHMQCMMVLILVYDVPKHIHQRT